MKVEIKANILKDLKNICITIDAPELTEEVQNIIDYISNISKKQSQIIADKDNKIYILELKDVICFFSKDKYNYVRTVNGIYRIKMKLYELEEALDKNDFIKISNSCIVNINQVECFDISILGTIVVKLKDDTKENVSKRNIKKVKQMLKERRF